MIGPSLEKSVKLQLAAEAAARALTAEETATIGKMKARAAQMTGIAAVLLVITVAAMAIGRYV
jgi:Flp pilus assembly protein TadG